ncbi:MAG: sigma-54-dependent transcriptional regulator [Syntrophobacteraceae bacterium]
MADTSLNILVVDDEMNIRKTLSMCLETGGHKVVAVSNFADAVKEASRKSFELAFVDLRLGAADGLDLIPALLATTPWLKIIVITAYASVETAVEAMRRGATDYLPKPFTPAQVELATRKVMEVRTLEQKVATLQEYVGRSHPEADFSTLSHAMQRAVNLARQVAPTDATILLRGESGTGKTLFARGIHSWSKRADKPLAIVSCPSLSPELLESELFGHVRGAFTGAVRDNPGRIAACEGGTLFLDEIGDLPLSLQPKLLRFLQDREYERIGDQTTRRADVRVIAATNSDLDMAVKEGRFREDLFYRLNVFQVVLPPLRERSEDIVSMAERFLAFFGRQRHRVFLGFTGEAVEALGRYTWPGNIRELHNVIERAAILCRGEKVDIDYLPENIAVPEVAPNIGDPVSLETVEELHIRRVLASSRSLQEAAETLGIDQATLWRRRKKYGI